MSVVMTQREANVGGNDAEGVDICGNVPEGSQCQ